MVIGAVFTTAPAARGQTTALYRLYGAGDALLYLGITRSLETRMPQHVRTAPWWPMVTTKTVMWYGSIAAAEFAEGRAIRAEKPQRNKYSGRVANRRLLGVRHAAPPILREGSREAEEVTGLVPVAGEMQSLIAVVPAEIAANLGMPPGALALCERQQFTLDGNPVKVVTDWCTPRVAGHAVRHSELVLVRPMCGTEPEDLDLNFRHWVLEVRHVSVDADGTITAVTQSVSPARAYELKYRISA